MVDIVGGMVGIVGMIDGFPFVAAVVGSLTTFLLVSSRTNGPSVNCYDCNTSQSNRLSSRLTSTASLEVSSAGVTTIQKWNRTRCGECI